MPEGPTLLTVDDEETIRRSIRVFFEDSGFEVLEAADGQAGIAMFRSRTPDIVLVDLRMPGVSGLEVIETLRVESPETPVVVLSGTGVVGDAIEAIRRGAWDFVSKPIYELAELEHVVNMALERARFRRESKRYQEHLEQEVSRRTGELRESEEKYRDLVENLNDVIYTVDIDGRVAYLSPAAEKLGGYEVEAVLGRHFKEFFLPQDWALLDEGLQRLLSGEPSGGEYRLLNKAAELVWVRASSRPTIKQGQFVGFQGVLTDISQTKSAEQRVTERARELAILNDLGREMGDDLSVDSAVNTALKHMQHSIDPDVVMLFLKQDHELILKGLTAKDDCHIWDSVPMHRVGDCLCGLAVANAKSVFSTDIHNDARCTMAECRAAGLQSFAAIPLESGNEIIGIMGMASIGNRRFEDRASFLDAIGHTVAIGLKNAVLYQKAQEDAHELQARLTQIQKAEQERENLTAQLQQAQKMEAIGTLAGGIAHDFNNILTPIIMGAELALMSIPVQNQAHALVEKVITSGMRAKDLVQQILTFSRQSDLERKPLRLIPTLKEALKLARASLPSTIEIQQDIRAQEDLVLANPTQVHQVLMNLITNAAHAMREQGGILEIALHEEHLDKVALGGLPELSTGHCLKLTVKDTGHGMDHRTMERIFDPFFTTKERGEGTGLGLSIVHGIIRSYDGAVRVESRLGEGTRFEVYLPLEETAKEVNREKQQQIPRGVERVLLVDDEPMIVEIHGTMLNALGYRVTRETDPRVALQTFSSDPQGFDLVITDMTMPKLTGDKLASEIMRIRPGMPVILCTGFSERISQEMTTDLGIRAFVMKPIGLADIANKIREVLG